MLPEPAAPAAPAKAAAGLIAGEVDAVVFAAAVLVQPAASPDESPAMVFC